MKLDKAADKVTDKTPQPTVATDKAIGKAVEKVAAVKDNFEKFDLIIGPTSPTTAFEFGSKTDNPLEMYLADIATVTANLAGVPGLSMPCGFDSNNMPIGLQMFAPVLQESKIIQAAYSYENLSGQAVDYSKIRV